MTRISMIRATIRSRGIRKTVYVVRYGERWCENADPRWFSWRNRIKIVASSIRTIEADEIAPSYLPSAILDRRARDTRAEPAKYAISSSHVDPTDGHVRICTLVAILQGPAAIARETSLREGNAMRLSATLRDFAATPEREVHASATTRWKIVGNRGKRTTRGSTWKKTISVEGVGTKTRSVVSCEASPRAGCPVSASSSLYRRRAEPQEGPKVSRDNDRSLKYAPRQFADQNYY